MSTRNKQKLIFISAGLALVLVWWIYSQNDERKIRKILTEIEDSLAENKDTSFPAILGKVKKTGRHFYPTAEVSFENPSGPSAMLKSRKDIEGRLLYALKNK